MFQNSSNMSALSPTATREFPEEQCSFDIMFGDGEGEFELHTNLFGARHTSPSETSRSLEATLNNNRKRKRDKDGFVTPTTPDIPKSSAKQGMSSQETLFETDQREDAIHGRDHKKGSWDQGQEEVLLSTGDCPRSLQTVQFTEPAVSGVSPPRGGGGKPVRNLGTKHEKSVSDLCKEISHEFIGVMQSCQEFLCGSEEYESQSIEKINKLLQEAREKEASLIRQKEYLHQRLVAISEHLKQSQETNH